VGVGDLSGRLGGRRCGQGGRGGWLEKGWRVWIGGKEAEGGEGGEDEVDGAGERGENFDALSKAGRVG
jgi:hypothetical protein